MSVALVAATLAKVRRMFPESAGAWSDATVQSAIYMADLLVKERAESTWMTQDLTLVQDGLYYDLPESVIWLGAVTYGRDGSTFKDGALAATTLADMDERIPNWETMKSMKPTHYILLSAPGIVNYSKIILWPAMASRTTEKVRLEYIGCYAYNLSFVAQTCEQWVVDDIYGPLVASMLIASREPDRAADLYARALAQIPRLFAESHSKYGDFYSPHDANDHRLSR